MAKMLEAGLKDVSGIKITQKVDSNGVFVIMPHAVAEELKKEYFFYPWDEARNEYRLMTSWDTTKEDIDNFIRILGQLMEEEK